MHLVADGIFKIGGLNNQDGQISCQLTVDGGHPILKGHFPGQAVVPGACMLQLVKEVVAAALSLQIQLKSAANIKFIQMILPESAGILKLTISYKITADNDISLNASIAQAATTCFKLQAVFAKA